MNETIRLLPDHIANQIAAGEVVQRPASVVKELMENSLDAGATRISLVIRDAGKSLIQIIDNGSGMSSRDARMCFERHATSKIRETNDLFNIRTMGFRGEAMASIAAVAQVTLKTRLHSEELGTEVVIEGNDVRKHEPCMTAKGTSIAVKNLFYNIPARRNFLKGNPVETRHIIQEFVRIAMAHPSIAFDFEHNNTPVYNLPGATAEQRIVDLMGKSFAGQLLPVREETRYLRMNGFLCTPQSVRKARGDQFFFVNNRFIKSNYLNHAITSAYQDLIPEDAWPFYALWLDIDPKHIDVNVHPTKTEIKFDDESTIYALLHSVAKKAIAAHLPGPVLANDEEGIGEIIRNTPPETEPVTIGNLNPWKREGNSAKGWEQLFEGHGQQVTNKNQAAQEQIPLGEPDTAQWMQFNARYLLSPAEEGLMILDMVHAHQRIIFEKLIKAGSLPPVPSQQLLFPKSLSFSVEDMVYLQEMEVQLRHLGFDLKQFGRDGYMLLGVPPELSGSPVEEIFEKIIADAKAAGTENAGEKILERLARSIAVRTSLPHGKHLTPREMAALFEQLMKCEHPGISPTGKPTWLQVDYATLDRHFQRNQ